MAGREAGSEPESGGFAARNARPQRPDQRHGLEDDVAGHLRLSDPAVDELDRNLDGANAAAIAR